MFNTVGFLGTKALLYMDIVTIYFALLPLLLLISIYFAVKKRYQEHFISQAAIFVITIIMVLIFEVGVRITGGFIEYAQQSQLSYDFLVGFLIAHIIVAVASTTGWLYQIIVSYKLYKSKGFESFKTTKHKKIGKVLFAALTVNSIMGVCIYLFLFVF